MTEPKKRLFVAVPLPQETLAKLVDLQNQLKPFARNAKWVKSSGIHLTLKFLGYVDPARIVDMERLLEGVSKSHSPVSIEAKGCGFFPNPRRPNVLWVGVQAPDLLPVQTAAEEAMASLGFEKENRAFSPHLTLARFKDPRGLLPLGQEVQKYANVSFSQFTANKFHLYESILHREGAEYRVLNSFPLVVV